MSSPQIYYALLFLVSAYTLMRGRSDERIAAATCVAAAIATGLVGTAPARASDVAGIALIDALVFAVFTTLALRSDRFWPLWLAGLQLAALYSQVLTAADVSLPQDLAPPASFWAYPIVLCIAAGTWRGARRNPTAMSPRLGLAS